MPKRAAEGEDGGQSSHIRTFLRIRPSKQASGYIKVDEHDKTRLGFHVPVETRDGEVSVMAACIRLYGHVSHDVNNFGAIAVCRSASAPLGYTPTYPLKPYTQQAR